MAPYRHHPPVLGRGPVWIYGDGSGKQAWLQYQRRPFQYDAIEGYSGAIYKSFESVEEAEAFLNDIDIVMNNDVLIKQENFFQSIVEIYNKEKFAVLGPDVYCPKAEIHQNPFRLTGIEKNEFKKMFFVEKITWK